MTLPNPLMIPPTPSGESFVFHSSYRGPEKLFRFTWTLHPGATGPGEHMHPHESHFSKLVSGELTVWLDGVRHDFKAPHELIIGPGVAHRFKNFGKVPAVVENANDGPSLEDFMIPFAVELHRRGGKMTPAFGAQLLVQLDATDPTIPVGKNLWLVRILRPMAKLFRALGVKPLPPVLGWDQAPVRSAA